MYINITESFCWVHTDLFAHVKTVLLGKEMVSGKLLQDFSWALSNLALCLSCPGSTRAGNSAHSGTAEEAVRSQDKWTALPGLSDECLGLLWSPLYLLRLAHQPFLVVVMFQTITCAFPFLSQSTYQALTCFHSWVCSLDYCFAHSDGAQKCSSDLEALTAVPGGVWALGR